jgi:membrane-associated protease RseP (regulator of RpoE activity)
MNLPPSGPNHSSPDFERQPTLQRSFLNRLLSREDNNLQIVLFLLTIGSTYWVSRSLIYSAAVLTILLAHEMGHYMMCRKHRIAATLPFFIPMPNIFGTMGAVIAMRQGIPNRKALFDVAVAGPLSGLIVAIPVIVIGLKNSQIITPGEVGGGLLTMGEPLSFQIIEYLVLGPLPEGKDVLVDSLAYAGWVGLFITGLNLLPVSQLDGGHIAYALYGKKSRFVFMAAWIVLAISAIFFLPWIVMLILITVFFKHPPTLDDITPLDSSRKKLGLIMFALFILTFIPVPIQIG